MSEDQSYNQVRRVVEKSIGRVMEPFEVDDEITRIMDKHGIENESVRKVFKRVGGVKNTKLKRIYNKQAIHLISLQLLQALREIILNKYKTLLDLNLLLTPFKINDLRTANSHQFKLQETENNSTLYQLIEELPESKDLLLETHETDELEEALQTYDDLLTQIKENLHQCTQLQLKLKQYQALSNNLEQRFNPQNIQKNLILSNNTLIVEQINRSRVLVEKVAHKLS